jgi:ABC-type hemin transport system substrate-binding protein
MLRKYESLKRTLKKAKERGVKVTFVSPLTKKSDSLLAEIKQVAEVKNVDMQGRLVLVDNKQVMFMLADDTKVHPSFDIGVWVQTPYFGSMLANNLHGIMKR